MVAATHGLFLPGAREKLDHPAVRDVFVTDTVCAAKKDWPRLRVVSIAPLIARALERFLADGSLDDFLTGTGVTKSCQDEVVNELVEIQRRATEYARRDGSWFEEEAFYAEQNARVVKNAEEYYRSMFLEEVSSWNLRDRHMAETLEALTAHLKQAAEQRSSSGRITHT